MNKHDMLHVMGLSYSKRIASIALICITIVGSNESLLTARKHVKPKTELESYIEATKGTTSTKPSPTMGSLWTAESSFMNLGVDYKAHQTNDLISVRVVEQTVADSNGSVKSQRSFSSESGISGLFGQLGVRSGLQTLASPHSDNSLSGQAQASTSSSLQTRLAGHISAVLPNGAFVIEASRSVEMNNQRQTLVVRGVARSGDIAPDNSVLSTSLSSLEVELNGKGVISDGVRPPNKIVRFILKILEF